MNNSYKLDSIIKVDEGLCINFYSAERYLRIPSRKPVDIIWN